MMSDEKTKPSTPVGNGRAAGGRFAPGNKLAKGNPFNKRAQKIRAALFKAVKPSDITEAVKQLMESAKTGDRQALAEILDRTIGRPVPADLLERIEALEEQAAQRKVNGEQWN